MTEDGRKKNKGHRVLAKHGIPNLQGYLCKIKGEPALGYMKEGEMTGYTTLNELLADAYSRDLPEYEPIEQIAP